jgi:4-amino-4-deoxy-L-arabinose transferase-like glycosyltransferase
MAKREPLTTLAVLACAFSLAAAGWAAWRQAWTYDEPFHLLWSERLLDSGITERESAERLDSKTPIMIPNVLMRRAAASITASERAQRAAARLPGLVWLALTFLCVARLGREAFGAPSAAIAVIGVALDPNMIAHASLATVDAAYACLTVATLGAAWRFARAPGPASGALLGLVLGLAFATKYTALLLVPGVALVFLLAPPTSPRRFPGALLVTLATAWLALSACYLFRESFVPLRAIELRSGLLGPVAKAAPDLPSPLPASFLTGLDRSLSRERGLEWDVVVLGARYPRGVWFYFPVVWLLKTPLALLALLLAGVVAALRDAALRGQAEWRALAANLALTLAYFCLLFTTQKGLRYVLMCIPLAWLVAGAGLARRPWLEARRLALLSALALAENLAYLGNPLSFTNAALQPKREAFRLLADSNIDWGQNRDKIEGWLSERGIRPQRLDPIHLLQGPNVFTLNAAAGVFDFPQHRWLRRNLDPVEHLGHTYLHFDVAPDEYERFMNEERRLEPDAVARELCPDELAYERRAEGSQLPFARDDPPAAERAWVGCVTSVRGVDLGLRVGEGRLRFGRFTPQRRCQGPLMQDEQVAWYRLAPGRHALCLVEVPNRRGFLPYSLRANWIVRGHSAGVHVRRLE